LAVIVASGANPSSSAFSFDIITNAAAPSLMPDALDDDILEKLKAAKKALSAAEEAKEEERQEQLRLERIEREKNKSFGELLKEFEDTGSKF